MLLRDAAVEDAVHLGPPEPHVEIAVVRLVLHDGLGAVGELGTGLLEAHAQLAVLRAAQLRVEATEAHIVGPLKGDVARAHVHPVHLDAALAHAALEALELQRVKALEQRHRGELGGRGDLPQHHGGPVGVGLEVLADEVRAHPHVVVGDDDDVAARRVHAAVARGGGAGVVLAQHAQRVGRLVAAHGVRGWHLRAIVHHDDLEGDRVDVLRAQIVEQLAQRRAAVVGGQHHAHLGLGARGGAVRPVLVAAAVSRHRRAHDLGRLRAGMPVATLSGGTSLTTTALAPMTERAPMRTGPRMRAPAPTQTSSSITG
jgi:hypothetical protein